MLKRSVKVLSWYDNWANWLNTTIDGVNHNQNNVGYYFLKSNSYYDKQYYKFGRLPHWEHKMLWWKKHRGRRLLYGTGRMR